jgi:hypothetical protein
MQHWHRFVVLAFLASLGLAVLTWLLLLNAVHAAEPAWTVRVSLPEPGYRQADGSLLSFTKFKGTRIMWGQCDAEGDLADLGGETTVRSWQFFGEVKIPAGRDVCITAVVIGLDSLPMGRSMPVRFSTKGTRPAAPWLKVENNA